MINVLYRMRLSGRQVEEAQDAHKWTLQTGFNMVLMFFCDPLTWLTHLLLDFLIWKRERGWGGEKKKQPLLALPEIWVTFTEAQMRCVGL